MIKIPVSLEFFPPKTPEGMTKLAAARAELYALKPEFCSVTYGAGGSTQMGTLQVVQAIRQHSDDHFHIEVAAYPETHPQARSPEADLKAFAAKAAAGANSAITQMFFNADAYFRFVDEVRAMGITIPIVPGIMPITNSSGLMRFADNSGCEIPRWMRLRLQSFGDDTASIKAFGLDVMAALCERLIAGGAPSLHFYTMNQAGATMALADAIGR